MLDCFVYDGARTPFGRHGGVLAGIRPDDLLAQTIRTVVERVSFPSECYEDVMVGCAGQAGEDSRCVARHAGLLAGLPESVPGSVLQRNCGSGLSAVISAAHALSCGEAELIVAGGVESMSRGPFVVGRAETAYARDMVVYNSSLGPRFPNPAFEQLFGDDSMAQTADNLAEAYQISREACDAYAVRSQQRYQAALSAGFFAGEIVPVELPARKGKDPEEVMQDEHPRPRVTSEDLARLRPLNDDGVTTAGNASGINDGAASIVLGTEAIGRQHGVEPIARILATAHVGVTPRIMGIGPVPAGQKALARAGLTLDRMDAIEVNEAFAAQVLACARAFGVADDDPRLNPNGGAIAIGHPLGASGPRILLTAINQLRSTKGRYALVSICVGLGQGVAAVVERL